jgi:hypothetical protein
MIKNRFEVGEAVMVTPKAEDDWHEFLGTVKIIRHDGLLITVEDQKGDCFDCDPDQVNLLE